MVYIPHLLAGDMLVNISIPCTEIFTNTCGYRKNVNPDLDAKYNVSKRALCISFNLNKDPVYVYRIMGPVQISIHLNGLLTLKR